MKTRLNRRTFLRLGGLAAAATALPTAMMTRRARANGLPDDQRYLFVLGAFGGGSIIDSFLPLSTSEAGANAPGLVAYPDSLVIQPAGSNIRCVGDIDTGGLFRSPYSLEAFLRSHYQEMAVLPVLNSSVNHVVAQKRAITGAGVNGGKTIMEAMAERHGASMPLPNCNMASGGYIEPGEAALDDRFRAEVITDPRLFAVSTHGTRGVPSAPRADLVSRARAVRETIDDASHFGQTFKRSARRSRFVDMRRETLPRLEASDLITKLMLLPDDADTPLSQFGLSPLPGAEREQLLGAFPRMLEDPLEGQAALAFLLARYHVSCSISIGLSPNVTILDSILDTPLAFDYSHTDHVTAQTVMWGRLTRTLDGLIGLLKSQDFDETDPSRGTLWDRSLIYVATDFGRDKTRPANALQFGTGHDLNNGNVLISPLIKGNTAWGGVDPATAKTFGDAGDGTRTTFREGHLYSAVATALDVDFTNRLDMGFVVG
jgi:hypothetical protein